MIQFEYPWVLLLLFFFIGASWWLKPKEDALIFPQWFASSSVTSGLWIKVLKWMGILSLLIALASPITTQGVEKEKQPGHAIMLVMDASQSMELGRVMRQGRVVDKFTIAKLLGAEFISKRVSDHVGIVVFGDFAYVASPLTFDVQSTSRLMEQLDRRIAGRKTAVYDGLFIATRMMKESKAKERIVIVLTDGEDTASKIPIKTALRAAKENDVKVYTIGVGNKGDYDERVLKHVAKESRGKYFEAHNEATLSKVYDAINALEPTELDHQKHVQKHYWYQWPLFIGWLSLLVFLYLKERRGIV